MPPDVSPICAAEVIFRVVRGRWALKLVATIADQEPIQFLALARAVPGMSRKVLAEQLRFLQQAGIVTQTRASDRQEVLYALTDRGKELKKAIDGSTTSRRDGRRSDDARTCTRETRLP